MGTQSAQWRRWAQCPEAAYVARGVAAYYRVGDADLFELDASSRVVALVARTYRIGLPIQSFSLPVPRLRPNQLNSDLKFYDYSGALNDASFQTHLTATNAWATAGFLTQADPSGAGNLLLVALRRCHGTTNGDSLFIFWRGMATPEGSDQPLIGNTSGTSANGIRLMVSTAGKLKVNAYQASGTLSRFGGTSTATCFEAAIAHSFAVAIDGVTGKALLLGRRRAMRPTAVDS